MRVWHATRSFGVEPVVNHGPVSLAGGWRVVLLTAACLWVTCSAWRVDAADAVFADRYAGEGIVRRSPAWNDQPLPVNIRHRWGLISQDGVLIVEPRFDWTDYMFNGLVRVELDGRAGFIDIQGEWVIDPIYRYADRYAEGSAIVGDGRRFGFVNRRGAQTVEFVYDDALRYRDQKAAVIANGLVGYLNRKGELAIDLKYRRGRSFAEGFAVVEEPQGQRSTRLLFIDHAGEVAYDATAAGVTALGDFSDGLAAFERDGKWGYLDRTFQESIAPTYDGARRFVGGLAAVKVDDQWGYIDKEGEVVIEPGYDEAWDFTDVLAMVAVDGKRGYIDREGRFAIEPQFEEASPFFREVARVGQSPSFGYIDVTGRPIWDPRAPDSGILDFTQLRPDGSPVRMQLPPRGRPRTAPYPADWAYEPELPKPRMRGRM